MKQINTLLIANRGEIAARIIRSCRKMGIKSIAVFSDADSDSLYVRQADTAVHIGESKATDSYLDQEKLIAAAQTHGADAIHPGYGFLSENAAFARRCAEAGLLFIGPNPNAIAAMGSKSEAKRIMQQQGVPVIPGYQGKAQDEETLMAAAKEMGFPLLLKATAGGGGKGMRIVRQEAYLEQGIAAAKREAASAFGDDELIIEKYIEKGRHIEFQIFGDQHGTVIHMLERECSIQRRYQKVMEESPSPVLDEALRTRMGEAAVRAAKALAYDNAGTVEFIFDDTSRDFYFLEINTRLQVEHPVTEEITGLDLVALQIEVAEGRPLRVGQDDIKSNGYAVEARLYAEDATQNFRPATGRVLRWKVPDVDGLRVETSVETGADISMHYDPMIAKLIVWAEERSTAHRKMAYTLRHLKCMGVTTNQDFLLHLFEQQDIQQGQYDTHYLDNHFDPAFLQQKTTQQKQVAAIGLCLFQWKERAEQPRLLSALPSGWRSNYYAPQQTSYLWDGDELKVGYKALSDTTFEYYWGEEILAVTFLQKTAEEISFRINGVQYALSVARKEAVYYLHSAATANMTLTEKERFPRKETETISGGYAAPMPSSIVKVVVTAGQEVKVGDPLLVISSMKMENTIQADADGQVEEVYVEAGQNVEAGFLLLKMK